MDSIDPNSWYILLMLLTLVSSSRNSMTKSGETFATSNRLSGLECRNDILSFRTLSMSIVMSSKTHIPMPSGFLQLIFTHFRGGGIGIYARIDL